MMNSRFILRRAIDTDNMILAQLNQQTFRETNVNGFGIPYGEHNLQIYFHCFVSPEIFSKKIAGPRQAVWLVKDRVNNDCVAFANAGPCELSHSEVDRNRDGELYRLYVRHDRQGYGVGRQLMNEALSWLEKQFPGRPIWLGVWAGNLKAQKFYQHYGFSKVGDYQYKVGNYKSDDFIMRKINPS